MTTYTPGFPIAGVDEAGRGPLAGPVIAAAVILDEPNEIAGLRDSKALSARRREALAVNIKRCALSWAIGRAEVPEIDEYNILQATLMAMARAVNGLRMRPRRVLVDGLHCPALDIETQAFVGGDAKIAAISAASILAKVERDAVMKNLDESFPGYGFAQHKGYPTRGHMEALEKLGVSAVHRLSFAPVKRRLDIQEV